jgi:hypothetical protein
MSDCSFFINLENLLFNSPFERSGNEGLTRSRL